VRLGTTSDRQWIAYHLFRLTNGVYNPLTSKFSDGSWYKVFDPTSPVCERSVLIADGEDIDVVAYGMVGALQ
jgi:hypothetical protein